MDQHNKAKVYVVVAVLFFIFNGYIKANPAIPTWSEPILSALAQIGTICTLFIGFVNYIANFGHDWTEDHIVKPVSGRVNAVTLACSDKKIAEIQARLEELIEAKKNNKEFWDQFF